MTATPQRELESRLNTLEASVEAGGISPDSADAIRAFIDAYDPNNLMENPAGDDSVLETGTLNTYLSRLTEAARRIEVADPTADDVNGVLQSLTDEGRSAWTVHGYSTAFHKFYGYHEGGPTPSDIARIKTPKTSKFDPDDLLTREEIHELRDAASEPRDRAIFDILIYTGMRNTPLRYLRVGDVDPHAGASGEWKVPDEGLGDEAEGLKDLQKYGKTRPLLGAKGSVRDWLSYHPASDNPDAFLITGIPRYGKADPSSPVAGSTVRRALDRLVKNTGNPEIEEKPTHPQMMRHNFVTVCKRDYKLPDETVKFLIGHSPGSKVMETTYSHLSDGDHNKRAEESWGFRDPDAEEESMLTPDACTVCGDPLASTAKACERCGAVYTPDAKSIEEEDQARIKDSYAQTGPGDDVQAKIKAADELLSDPDVKSALLAHLNDE